MIHTLKMVLISHFDLLPRDIVFIIVDKLDFDSAMNLMSTTMYNTQKGILKHLVQQLSEQLRVLIAQQKYLDDIHSIKKFVSEFRNLQKHQNIISNAVNVLREKTFIETEKSREKTLIEKEKPNCVVL